MEDSARILAAAALAMLQCLLASLALAQCHQASLPPRQVTRQRLQASAVLALALPLPPMVPPAHSIRPLHLVYRRRRQATIHRRLRVTRLRHLATRRLLHRSLQHRQHTVQPHQHILELLHRTTAPLRHASVLRRHSIARPARSSTRRARGAPLRHRHHLPSVPRVRRTRQPVLLATLSTRLRRHATRLPLRARRHTLQNRGGRRPAQRTRLRKSTPVIVVPLHQQSEANVSTGLLSKIKVPCAYHKRTYGT
jgi:hypothetical protein